MALLELGGNSFRTDHDHRFNWLHLEEFIKEYKTPALESLSFKGASFHTDWSKDMQDFIKNMGSSNLKTLDLQNIDPFSMPPRRNQTAEEALILKNELSEKIWLPLLTALEDGQFSHLEKLDIRQNYLGRSQIMGPKFEALEQKRKVLILRDADYRFNP